MARTGTATETGTAIGRKPGQPMSCFSFDLQKGARRALLRAPRKPARVNKCDASWHMQHGATKTRRDGGLKKGLCATQVLSWRYGAFGFHLPLGDPDLATNWQLLPNGPSLPHRRRGSEGPPAPKARKRGPALQQLLKQSWTKSGTQQATPLFVRQ